MVPLRVEEASVEVLGIERLPLGLCPDAAAGMCSDRTRQQRARTVQDASQMQPLPRSASGRRRVPLALSPRPRLVHVAYALDQISWQLARFARRVRTPAHRDPTDWFEPLKLEMAAISHRYASTTCSVSEHDQDIFTA